MTLQASYNEESHSFELAETMMPSSEKPHDMYQRYRSSKADMLKPVVQVGIRPNAPICSYCVIVFVVVWPKNMYMYKISSSLFFITTLIVFWAGNAMAVLRCKPS